MHDETPNEATDAVTDGTTDGGTDVGSPGRFDVLRRHRYTFGLAGLVFVIGWLHGVILRGRSFPLSTVTSTNGWVHCLNDGLLACPYVGYPSGVRMSIGIPHYGGAFLLGKLGIGPPMALNLLAIASLALGSASIAWIVHRVGGSRAAGLIAVALYYLAPSIVGHRGLLTLYFAFVLLPVPVAAAVEALAAARADSVRRSLLAGAATFVAASLVIYSDPYGWAIAFVIGGGAALAVASVALVRKQWARLGLAGAVVGALALPAAVFAATVGSDSTASMPRDLHRAMGVDLAVMFVPTPATWFNTTLQLPIQAWDRSRFYGDGTNLGTYFGAFTLAAAVAGAVMLLRRRSPTVPLVSGLVIGGAACFLLGLGPSLKVLDTAAEPIAPDGRFTFTDYLMPSDEATLTFPWDFAFGVQPLESMRATYRWHVGLRLVTAVAGAIAVTELWRRRPRGTFPHGPRLVAGGLALVLLLETGSPRLWNQRRQASASHDHLISFHNDMDATFGNGGVAPFERVLFLPASNDYLVMDIAPRYRFYAWNIAFDKEISRLRPLQPAVIERAGRYMAGGLLDSSFICELFEQDLVDVVVFTNFHMRWDSYSWPPRPWSVAAQYEANAATGVFDNPAFVVEHRPLASIVRLSPASPVGRACADG